MKGLILIWNWLVKSSADADKISLTVKGGLLSIIPIAIFVFKAFNIEIGTDQLNSVADSVVALIGIFAAIVSSIQIAVGMIRKIWTTLDGTNSVIVASSKE